MYLLLYFIISVVLVVVYSTVVYVFSQRGSYSGFAGKLAEFADDVKPTSFSSEAYYGLMGAIFLVWPVLIIVACLCLCGYGIKVGTKNLADAISPYNKEMK